MSKFTFEYRIGKSVSLGRVKKMLRDELNLVEASTDLVEITCMDSFDWRIYASSGVIESENNNGSTLLSWRTLNSHDYLFSVETNKKIDFAWNLPDGEMKKRLSKALKVRALLPQVVLRVKRNHWVKLDREQKTVVRAVLEDIQLWDKEKDSFRKLEIRIRLIPVRGYQKAIERAGKLLRNIAIVEQTDIDIYLTALTTQNRKPGDYKPKAVIPLLPEMRTDQATKAALLAMLNMLEANESGVRNNIDSEFLHDYRIAVRKTRSAFSQIKGVFPKHVVDRYRNQFAWLGGLTSPARDMDVYLLKLESYRNMLPKKLRIHLDPLRSVIVSKRDGSYKALAKALSGKRYHRLLSDYREFLTSPVPLQTRLPNASKPVKLVANQRIWKMYRRVMKEGKGINEKSPDEDLHELRKTCKKLRYLIEFFQSLYDADQMSHLIVFLKKLQDNLGDFNDLHVQKEALEGLLVDMENFGPVSAETEQAIAELIAQLDHLQMEKRKEFAGQFSLFCKKENKRLYRQLFNMGSQNINNQIDQLEQIEN